MSVKLKMHDAAIGFIGSGFDLIAAVCYSFVTQPWQLYAGSLVFHAQAAGHDYTRYFQRFSAGNRHIPRCRVHGQHIDGVQTRGQQRIG